MKHGIEEIYTIYGKRGYFTKDYLIANNIKMREVGEHRPAGKAAPQMCIVGRDAIIINTAKGAKEVYMMGEKTFFDTRLERDMARQERAEALAESARRKRAMEKINALTTEELEKLVATL